MNSSSDGGPFASSGSASSRSDIGAPCCDDERRRDQRSLFCQARIQNAREPCGRSAVSHDSHPVIQEAYLEAPQRLAGCLRDPPACCDVWNLVQRMLAIELVRNELRRMNCTTGGELATGRRRFFLALVNATMRYPPCDLLARRFQEHTRHARRGGLPDAGARIPGRRAGWISAGPAGWSETDFVPVGRCPRSARPRRGTGRILLE